MSQLEHFLGTLGEQPHHARRSDRPYKGDCGGKVWSRSLFYEQVRLLPAAARGGMGVFLAGPTPEDEIAAIREAGWPTDQLVGCDVMASAGLFSIPVLAPGAIPRCADVCQVLKEVGDISWFFGDFMGFSKHAAFALSVACRYLLPGGVVGLTVHRGREKNGNAPDVAKDAGGIDALIRMTTDCPLELVYDVDYHRPGGLAMGSLAWRNSAR